MAWWRGLVSRRKHLDDVHRLSTSGTRKGGWRDDGRSVFGIGGRLDTEQGPGLGKMRRAFDVIDDRCARIAQQDVLGEQHQGAIGKYHLT